MGVLGSRGQRRAGACHTDAQELAGVTEFDFFDAAWQFVLVAGLSFGVLALLASMVRFYQLSNPTMLMPVEAISGSTRFAAQVAERLGTAYRLPQPFCLLIGDSAGPVDAAARGHYVAAIQRVIRKSDVALTLDDGRIGILLDGPRRHLESARVRIQAAVAAQGGVRLGAVSCPENGVRVQTLIEAANGALLTAGVDWKLAEPLAATEAAPAAGEEGSVADQDDWLDKLTGVLRSDRLERVMPKYVARYRREAAPVSMIYLDVDYLTRYNDHYGHAAGDEILRGIGHLLQRLVREDDLIGRTAGDDFVILLNCTPAEALLVAHRLMQQIKQAAFTVAGYALKVTVSGGIAGYPDHGRTAAQILKAAHAALLAAHDRGRNMCLLFDATMQSYEAMMQGADKF